MVNVLKNLDWSVLVGFALSVIPAMICISVHETCHGLAALWMGDTTAKRMGRLSLNPLKHFDIWGFVMMATVGFGWAKPVPIDMRRFKNPKRGMALSALAGPVSNIILAVIMYFICGAIYSLQSTTVGYYVFYTVARTAQLSVGLAIFNIIPIPPLDGSKVLFSLVSDEAYYKLMRYEKYGMILLVILLISGKIDGPLNTAVQFMTDRMDFAVQLGYDFSQLFV